MSFTNPSAPNLTDFTTFVENQGVPPADLPTNPNWLQWALDYATNTALVPPCDMPPIIYVMAVYNLGLHWLIKFAQDQAGQTFFGAARKQYNMSGGAMAPGIVSSTADNGTSMSLTVPQSLQNLTLQGLDLLRTPWGLSYLEYAQSYGPNIVGVS